MPSLRSIFFIFAACLLLAGCGRTEELVTVVDAPTEARAGTKLDAVTQAILAAGSQRGWQKTLLEPGLIRAKLITGEGKHMIEVSIRYTEKDFSIQYADSYNMNYEVKDDGEKRIHPKYNSWVQILKDDIQQSIENLP